MSKIKPVQKMAGIRCANSKLLNTLDLKIDFKKNGGLVPAVVQHAESGRVLMVGMMNEEAICLTRETKEVTFFSRTKNRIWKKGETSGNILKVKGIALDCDNDAILIKALPTGPVCHTGEFSCFYQVEENVKNTWGEELWSLSQVIKDRACQSNKASYVSSLLNTGLNKIAQKVGEEGVEVVIAALGEDRSRVIEESSDLVFHLLVLLRKLEIDFDQVIECLRGRSVRK